MTVFAGVLGIILFGAFAFVLIFDFFSLFSINSHSPEDPYYTKDDDSLIQIWHVMDLIHKCEVLPVRKSIGKYRNTVYRFDLLNVEYSYRITYETGKNFSNDRFYRVYVHDTKNNCKIFSSKYKTHYTMVKEKFDIIMNEEKSHKETQAKQAIKRILGDL